MQLTPNDVAKILDIIRLNYENTFSGYTPEEATMLRDFWYETLKKYPKELVNVGVQNAISNCQFAPRLANIIEEINKIRQAGAPSEEQLWGELEGVLPAVYQISRYLPYPQYSQWTENELDKIYDNLNDELKLYVVNRSTLLQLCEMSDDDLKYERARFFKNMPALRKNYFQSLDAKQFLIDSGNADIVKKIEDKKRK